MDGDEWVNDAAMGLDVGDNEDDIRRPNGEDTASKWPASSSSRKRPRSKPASIERMRPQKPKPPPAPPASLVALMRKDKSVLQFFTSLQENVTYDVDKWKHEAAHWKRMASLPSSASKQDVRRVKRKISTKQAQRKSTTRNEKKQNNIRSLGGKQNNDDEEGSTIPITDEALFGDFSDSEEERNDLALSNAQGNDCSEKTMNLSSAQSVITMHHTRRSLILGKLVEAKRMLDLLGLSLVVVETKPPPSNEVKQASDGGDHDENEQITFLKQGTTDKTSCAERIFHRQSDETVVEDMMASLRTLIEASSCIDNDNNTLKQQMYSPFYRRGKPHCPNVYFGRHEKGSKQTESFLQHPASVGLKYLIDVLVIMDVYCHGSFDEDDWELIFEDIRNHDDLSREDAAILRTGMRNRSLLVEKLLSSLHVEITQTWAITERALNIESLTMHFYPTEEVPNEGGICDAKEEYTYSVKNFNRLVSLEEKIAHGRIASLLQRRLGAFQKATELVLGYIISAAPSLGVDQYHPKIPPALSMCVLESLLSPEDHDPVDMNSEKNEEWFCQDIQYILSSGTTPIPNECSSLLLKSAAIAVRTAANIWKERCSCSDRRIRDVALVEAAAYKRLLCLANGKWLNIVGSEESELSDIRTSLSFCHLSGKLSTNTLSQAELGLSCVIVLITIGKNDEIIKFCRSAVSSLQKESGVDNKLRRRLFSFLPAYCFAYTKIMSRSWEAIKLLSASSGRCTIAAFGIKNEFTSVLEPALDAAVVLMETETDCSSVKVVVDALIQCCKLLGDAALLYRLAKRVSSSVKTIEGNSSIVASQRAGTSKIMSSLLDASLLVTVRVINLQRRHDRLLDFFECAVNSRRMLVMKGVVNLKRKSSILGGKTVSAICDKEDENTGGFAFDGQCSKDELETKITNATRGKCVLSDFVEEEWKPSELSAFDTHAGSDFKDAHMTTSEMACALSHIASWIGVKSSLSYFSSCLVNDSTAMNQDKVVSMLTISGFARGPPLLNENADMDPSPVCVILEDDAILCDRFVERLESLLDELPRDFHFCSLGYSRPKHAPIIDYSPEIGIPSCLWYLTGYVLSEAGAEFLISSLPVVGPVDSWIAVKMRDNFANRYGEMIGVGKHARAHNAPSLKDLSKIMKFRAFAAKAPLCTQKQYLAQPKGTRGGGNWRAAKRDSDVEYSGY